MYICVVLDSFYRKGLTGKMLWIILVLIYGLVKGLREVLKKKALERNTTLEVLLMYTTLSFLIVTPEIRNAGGVDWKVLLFVAVKSLTIFFAWMCGFTAVAKLPISLYGVLDLSRVLFSTLLGVIVLHETMGIKQLIGLALVLLGLLMLNGVKLPHLRTRKLLASQNTPKEFDPETDKEKNTPAPSTRVENEGVVNKPHNSTIFIVLAFISCLLNAVSGLFDKLLMTYTTITDGQLQFWYMLFLVVFYLLYAFLKRPKPPVNWKSAVSNKWIWVLAVLFVIADRCLFIANSDPASKVTVMTLLKQSGVIFAIICGRFVFKEKHTGYRLFCALIILLGIFVSVLPRV
ncbi:MAG: DMT family transporter [Lachnospiraceae bacterium]|nr:DMT family transporter [Lachnospiraceae bacterium]